MGGADGPKHNNISENTDTFLHINVYLQILGSNTEYVKIPSSDVTNWLSCIVGSLSTGFWKARWIAWGVKKGDISCYAVSILIFWLLNCP